MNTENEVVKLCILGTQAEFAGRPQDARAYYLQAWDAAQDDYEFCIAAHYVARFQSDPRERLRWNRLSLEHADAANDARVADFYPSLYLNMGQACERTGDLSEADRYYQLASDLGFTHQAGDIGDS